MSKSLYTANASGSPAAAMSAPTASGLQVSGGVGVVGVLRVAPLQLPEDSPSPRMPFAGACSHGPAMVVIALTDTLAVNGPIVSLRVRRAGGRGEAGAWREDWRR